MNLSPISTASSNPPHAETARGVDSADTQAFSSVLLQQQGQARGRDMVATSGTAAADIEATDADQHDSLIPDEALALLAVGATLSLMTSARTVAVDKPRVDTSRTIERGSSTHDGRTTAQTRARIEDRSLLASGKALADTAAWLEASDHVADPTSKDHQIKQAKQAVIHQADDATLARINARIAGTPAVADSRSISALGAHPAQPSRPPQLDPFQVAPQQVPTTARPELQPAITAAVKSTDRPTPQGLSAMPTNAGPSPTLQPAITTTAQSTDRPAPQGLSAMPTSASLPPATARPEMQPVITTAAQSTDLPNFQALSAMPTSASLPAGTSAQGQATNPTMLAVPTPLSSPTWATDFSRQFVTLAQGNPTQFHAAELRLDPPDLGPVRITLHISDSVAQAVFVSPHAVVRQTIENALPQLQQQLAQAGLSLGQANVSDQQPSQQGFQQTSSQDGGNTSFFSLSGDVNAQDIAPFPVFSRQALRSPDALVDTFA